MVQTQSKIDSSQHEQIETKNPTTGQTYKVYDKHTKESAEGIIDKTHEAFLKWRETSLEERANIIRQIAQCLADNKDELARMMANQMGKPISQGKSEVDLCVNICTYTADNGPKELKQEERKIANGKGIVSYEPIGVILGMQPWNFPCYQVVRYSIANIMAGNTTALKHAEICWSTAQKLKQIYEDAGLPTNVFSVLYVDDETVDELISHEKVRGVTMTGSAKAGKIVAQESGKYLKKTVLELGGSDPYIVLEDVKLDEIMETCVRGRINNGGQTCIAAKRFIVLEDIYDEFKEEFVTAMKSISYGNPVDDEPDMGPLAREDLRNKLHDQVQESVKKGATVLCGGEIADGAGYFYPATVLENVKPGMPAYDDELFGPVATLIKVSNEDEAIRVANDHRYGLGGGVFSGNKDRALKLAHKIDTGMVNVNSYNLSQPSMPFGGVKESGYGREHGGFGIKEFVNIKSIMMSD
ncbi:NAD-dependent succinate-semialdehyde dehydrogenase [Pleurocapsales cyanobacterium LEGE 10410]|nr:NAD-dependent succinate-semialdehyde dehydrogenase [Pleurocapsales cyanobacterium LEGE 10410]